MKSQIKVAFLPTYQNPYQQLLANAMNPYGISVESLTSIPSISWLFQNRYSTQILHLHWLSGLYMHRYLTPFRLVNFIAHITIAKYLGYKIIWTAHNLLPHKRRFLVMHRFVRRFIMQTADAVITHCQFGNEILKNYAIDICGCKTEWSMKNYLDHICLEIQERTEGNKVLLLISGGVDSSVVGALLLKALNSEKVYLMYIDTGLMRKDETSEVESFLKKMGARNLFVIHAEKDFLDGLAGYQELA